jgi:primosomal protein N'
MEHRIIFQHVLTEEDYTVKKLITFDLKAGGYVDAKKAKDPVEMGEIKPGSKLKQKKGDVYTVSTWKGHNEIELEPKNIEQLKKAGLISESTMKSGLQRGYTKNAGKIINCPNCGQKMSIKGKIPKKWECPKCNYDITPAAVGY